MADEINLEEEISAIQDPRALRVISYLLEQIKVLQEKVAILEKNSKTSSKPPSSDITKPDHEQRQPGKRKIGGQPRHKGKARDLLPPEEVDRREELRIDICPECGDGFDRRSDTKVLVQQTIEFRAKPVEVVEYHRQGRWCYKCQTTHYAPLPPGVIEGQLCGPRLQALIGYMKGNLGASYTELSQFCADVLGVTVSRGMICNVISRVNQALEQPYEELFKQISQEDVLNIDESGWRDSGTQYWVWLFCTNAIAFFVIEASRGSKVLRKVLGETFDGAIISDFYSAYVSYANIKQQFCLAHLIRDIKFLTTLPDKDTKEFGEKMLAYFKLLFRHWHARDQMPKEVFEKRCDKLQRRIFTFLLSEHVPKGKATTLKKRLIKHWKSLFRFVQQPALYQPTNNLAEQTLRHLVRIRRQTQGSRSEWGRSWCGRILTVIATCRKQNRSSFNFILQAVNANYFTSDFPSLSPT
jgi:transposase